MHREHGRAAGIDSLLPFSEEPLRGELMRRPQPQPRGITWPNRSATRGGTSMIGPDAVWRTCGWRGNEGDPTILTGAMLASVVNPSLASVSSAQSERSLIDHSGARNAVTLRHAGRSQGGDALLEICGERVLASTRTRAGDRGRAIRCHGRRFGRPRRAAGAGRQSIPRQKTSRELRRHRAYRAASASYRRLATEARSTFRARAR